MRLTRREGLAALAGLVWASPALALTAGEPDWEADRAKSGAPGLAAGWQRGQDGPQLRVAGIARADAADKALRPDARWHLGSLTKAMTATLAARAVEAGWIDWDSSIANTLGPLAEGMNPAYADVTLLHLLSHQAGLVPDIARSAFGEFSRHDVPDARSERLRYALIALGMEPLAAPATRMIYANNGYVVAAAMLEARMGAPWETLIRHWVFEPLGLASAGFGLPGHPHDASGHIVAGDGTRIPLPIDNPVALSPAGRVHMALPDLLRFLAAHRDGDPRFLSRKSWRTLHTPPFGGDYALGWIMLPDGRLWHNGSNGFWYAEALIGSRTVAAVVRNDASARSGQPGALIQQLASL
ncbi:MAG: beta-lactamase family protein [Sphingomonadales bacterium]|jgi:CubicO group peptidase (beta-lactamase class C family)|nr:beta-lactamase family protein [Sphingomonadales bacterium]